MSKRLEIIKKYRSIAEGRLNADFETQNIDWHAASKSLQEWLDSLNQDEAKLSGAVLGFATVRRKESMDYLLGDDDIEKLDAEFRKRISNIYLEYAKEFLYCAK